MTNNCTKAIQTEPVKVYNGAQNVLQNNFKDLATAEFSQEFIASVHDNQFTTPIIYVNVKSLKLPFLIDTGSSISIISKETFQIIKAHSVIKYLSRKVRITTINSTVDFTSCVMFSFKLGAKFCSHAFYVVDCKDSKFSGILGFDAINKFNLLINPSINACTMGDEIIPFVEHTNLNSNENIQVTSDVENCNIVKLAQKLVLPPSQHAYIKVKTPLKRSTHVFLFQPKSNFQDIHIQEGIYQVNNENEEEMNTSNSFVKEDEIFDYFFYVLITNNSPDVFHLNKDSNIGTYVFVDIKPSDDSVISQNVFSQQVNYITPSTDVLELRGEEFNLNNFNLEHLNENEKKSLRNLLTKFKHVFSSSLKTLGHTDLVTPDLKFTSDFPVKTLPFPIPQALQEEAQKQIEELLEAGIIEKHISNWACPMLLVKKKSDDPNKQKYRLALDLRLLNTIIQHATYPLPKINNLISQLNNFKYFTSLDMPSAYHQVDLPQHLHDKLTFITPWATYCYKRMVFGLKTAASTFQALMDKVIEESGVSGVFAYQDDLIVASNSFPETIEKLTNIFEIFRKHNLTLCPNKCAFHLTKITYLGFEISQKKVFPISTNIIKITSFPRPSTKRQMKRFLGTTGYYRNLIPNYAEITNPLVKLTCPKSTFVWTDIHENSFTTLQNIFFNRPFLQQPDFTKEFYLNTDASKVAISAILMQKHEDQLLPVSYFSKALKPSETRYPAIKLELLAIVKGIQAFNYYLMGRHFIILSDSKPLQYFSKITSPSDITTRWLLTLSEYSYSFQHLPGRENVLADLFSRTKFNSHNITDVNSNPDILLSKDVMPVVHEENNAIKHSSEHVQNLNSDPLLEISEETILREQLKDKKLAKIY